MEKINRIKAILAESDKTSKWLSLELGKDPVTMSKWFTNTVQPDLPTLVQIGDLLDINVRELLVSAR